MCKKIVLIFIILVTICSCGFNEHNKLISKTNDINNYDDFDYSKITEYIYYSYNDKYGELSVSLTQSEDFPNQTTFNDLCHMGIGPIFTITFTKGERKFYPGSLHKAFFSYELHNINGFENVDTTYCKDFSYCFYECMALNDDIINNIKTDNGEDFSHMFEGSYGISSFDASLFDFSSAKNLNCMFCDLNSLEFVDFSNCNLNNVESAISMFSSCPMLENVDFSNSSFEKCKNVVGMFDYCDNLINIDFTNARFSSVIYMGDMFGGCRKLKKIDLSSFDFSNLLDCSFTYFMGEYNVNEERLFCEKCDCLEKVFLPRSFSVQLLKDSISKTNFSFFDIFYYKDPDGKISKIRLKY